ncbi:MAG: alpha-amylase family glycosyl hydrolase [Coriobacteriales bacterium]|nr:alpha-amylase family glycosyl hydrolase [Coriobacteriales bacterium]
MAWYDEAVFYHIYPLGLTGAPKHNDYGEPVRRLRTLLPWIDHIRRLGCTALYIGPLFQSVGHGYETTDYLTLDSRLGTNEDLVAFVEACHDAGIRVVFDGVFNHTGRDFFAFADIRQRREASAYQDWYCNVNFWGNNEYGDGFSYDTWGGYDLLAKLNQRNPAVRDYLCDVVRFWVSEFNVDGIRLDAADVLDFDFMCALRQTADAAKPDFWLMGEVIHGDYSRWANERTLHSVTDYALHKGLYSGHNDHNYFEIAHTVQRTCAMVPAHIKLYNFVDNHDVERISSKLQNKAHYLPVHVLLYTLPGIPSIYYGSEFGIEGKKERFSDDSLRPAISLDEHADDFKTNPCTQLIAALGKIHATYARDLAWGDYRQLHLTCGQYAFARGRLVVAVNNSAKDASFLVGVEGSAYVGLLGGQDVEVVDGRMEVELPACGGEIYAPVEDDASGQTACADEGLVDAFAEQAVAQEKEAASELSPLPDDVEVPAVPLEQMTVEQLQAYILARMAANGPVTDQMRRDVANNIWPDSLLNWARSF